MTSAISVGFSALSRLRRSLRGSLTASAALSLLVVTACSGGNDGGGQPESPAPIGPPTAADTTPPSVPQSVTATAKSAAEIDVTWQASSDAGTGVAGYRIFRDGVTTAIATVAGTNHTDTNLTPATQYSYTVRAFDRGTPANESAPSQPASATTPATGNPLSLTTEPAFPNLPNFAEPVSMLHAPGDDTAWYVVEQAGRVRVFDNQPNVATTRAFIDISSRVSSGGEAGLLGMAFHPDYPADPRAYLSYTNNTSGFVSRISEFRTRDGGGSLDPSSEVIVLSVAQPARNHNGGHIGFGPDGFLYIGFGDGGQGGDPWGAFGNGQDLRTVLGKLLRIDIDGSTGSVPYRIPAGNPYAGNALCSDGSASASCPEIFAYGFRNPWRWSFDRAAGDLWLADVGQAAIEEVNRVTAGGNYGWRCFEGTRTYNADCGPNADSSLPPVAEYDHDAGQSITGGYVYRGREYPALVGRYVFGDFISGRLWSIPSTTTPTLEVTAQQAFATSLAIASFAESANGELYLVDYRGTLHRLRGGD